MARVDRIRNDVVRDRMEAPGSVNLQIGQQRLKWYGHVRKMSAERWPT